YSDIICSNILKLLQDHTECENTCLLLHYSYQFVCRVSQDSLLYSAQEYRCLLVHNLESSCSLAVHAGTSSQSRSACSDFYRECSSCESCQVSMCASIQVSSYFLLALADTSSSPHSACSGLHRECPSC